MKTEQKIREFLKTSKMLYSSIYGKYPELTDALFQIIETLEWVLGEDD